MVDQSVVASISLDHRRYQCKSELEVRASIRAVRALSAVLIVVDRTVRQNFQKVCRSHFESMGSRVYVNFFPIFLVKKSGVIRPSIALPAEGREKTQINLAWRRITAQTNTLLHQ